MGDPVHRRVPQPGAGVAQSNVDQPADQRNQNTDQARRQNHASQLQRQGRRLSSELAQELDMSLEDCAQRFGTVSLPESERGWRFHPVLGFAKRR